MDPLFNSLDLQDSSNVSSQRVSEPEALIVECARIQAENYFRVANLVLESFQIVLNVPACFLVSFGDHHNSLLIAGILGRGSPCNCNAFTTSIEQYVE